jgi:hypothetical protein
MKKIVAHIQRTVTISTVKTTLDVSVSDDANAPAIPPRDPEFVIPNSEGEKDEKTNDVSIRSNSIKRKPARGVRPDGRSKRKSQPGNGGAGRSR